MHDVGEPIARQDARVPRPAVRDIALVRRAGRAGHEQPVHKIETNLLETKILLLKKNEEQREA